MKIGYAEDVETRGLEITKRKVSFKAVLIALASMGIAPMLGFLDWRLDNLSHFRLHFIVLTLFIVILSLFLDYKFVFMWGLISLFLSMLLLAQFVKNGNLTFDLKSGTYSVSTINVLFNNESREHVRDEIKARKFDIVVLTEVNNSWDSYLRSELSDMYKNIIRVEDSGRDDILVLTNFKVLEKSPFKTSGNHSGMRLIVEIDDKEVVLYGIHPYSPMSSKYWELRNTFFTDLATEIQKESRPVIIAGDFNSSLWSFSLKNFQNDTSLNYVTGFEGTYPAYLKHFGIDIDHIFYSNDLAMSRKYYLDIKGTDHRGVWSEFSFNGT